MFTGINYILSMLFVTDFENVQFSSIWILHTIFIILGIVALGSGAKWDD